MTLCAASQFRGESYRVRHAFMQEGWPLKSVRASDAQTAQILLMKHNVPGSRRGVTTVLAVDLRMSVRSQCSGGMGLINSMLRWIV